jgi:hypothetical protein
MRYLYWIAVLASNDLLKRPTICSKLDSVLGYLAAALLGGGEALY